VVIEDAWKDPRVQQIVTGLLARSRRGELGWQIFKSKPGTLMADPENDSEPDGFSYSTESATVVIGTVDGDGVAPFYLEVLDSAGIVVESVTIFPPIRTVRDESGNMTRPKRSPEERDFLVKVREIYSIARRRALRTDEVLDTLATDLGV
jgi:hypothetical protein